MISPVDRAERLAWMLVLPALLIVVVIGIFPLGWTVWESLHRHDLRMPWLGMPWVGMTNYARIVSDPRFWTALGHTSLFATVTVSLELVLGLFLALSIDRSFRGRGMVRAAILVPWGMPTVVAALLWRFLFESDSGIVNRFLLSVRLISEPHVWFLDPWSSWIPIILADVWKTTPFVALILLAGLQNIPASVYEASAVDGAGWLRRLWSLTIPLLRPAILVALVFRTMDAFRVFDLIYVLTSGGPGTATEPIALYTFNTLFQNLRFGYGSALSVIVFAVTFGLAMIYMRLIGGGWEEER